MKANGDVITDRAVLAIRVLVHIPEGDLLTRAPVVPLEGACEGAEGARHLPFRGQVRRRGTWPASRRDLPPVRQ